MARDKYLKLQSGDVVDEIFRRLAMQNRRITELEHMLYKRHNYTHWLLPDLINGWAQPADTIDQFAYRLTGSIPDFKGHLDGSSAISPSVAFNIALDPDEMTLPGDIYFHTIVTDGVDFQSAMVFINSLTGDVRITFPAT